MEGTINGHPFQTTLEPDGKLSHWLKLSKALQEVAGVTPGDMVTVQISPATPEPEPQLPDDLREALAALPAAKSTWDGTTTIARLDWIHWVESAKQAKTRTRRVENACDMLASGKKRVCCFDPSGYYSKSLSAPKADK
ncbi:hypothetical protein PT7_3139 [Pusillimonas sp. T7-7]|nr:hypothetical protein PT7_3139 [Pusillimonas sp. T7-7]